MALESTGQVFHRILFHMVLSDVFLIIRLGLWVFRKKTTKVKCHSCHIVSGMCVLSCSVLSDSLQSRGLQPARLLCPWDSPDKNTGVGCHALLQGIFPTQGLIPGLRHFRWNLNCLSHQGSRRILEWVACPFSRGIFPTQESNQGLLQCRRILYQLSYQGSPVAW